MSTGTWDRVNPKLHQHREVETNPDALAHFGANSGCSKATEKLGKQSLCLECPFNECVFVSRKR